MPFASPGGNAACARSAAHRTPCRCCTAACARRCLCRRIPCTGCIAARARKHRCCSRRTPCTGCAAARARAPAGRQTTRAHATRSEPNVVPIKAESRFQIPKKFGDGDEKRGGPQISVTAFDFCRSALQISVKRSRFQIVQITSQRLCAGEKQKSAAAFAFWIQQIAEKKNPRFVETCTFRILVAYADPNVSPFQISVEQKG